MIATVSKQADDYVNGRLSIGRIDGNLFFGVEMEDVDITVNGEQVIGLKDVGIDYNFLTFLTDHVVLATAHAAKFPEAVEAACGVRPRLPDWLAGLTERPERVVTLPVDQAAIEHHILSLSRAAQGAAA